MAKHVWLVEVRNRHIRTPWRPWLTPYETRADAEKAVERFNSEARNAEYRVSKYVRQPRSGGG